MMKIVAVGENTLDYYFEENQRYIGGNCINFLMQLSKCPGLDLSYVGPVATDEDGSNLIALLNQRNINIGYISVIEGSTPRAHIKRGEKEPVFLQLEKGVLEDFFPSEEEIEFIRNHDHIHCSIMGGMLPYLEQFKENPRLSLSFDYSKLQNRKLIEYTAQWVDYLFLSREKLGEEEKALMESVCKSPGKQVIFLLGKAGSVVYDGKTIYRYTEVGPIVDTLGAGDAYIAGYIENIKQGKSIEIAMKMATKRALHACGHRGGFL